MAEDLEPRLIDKRTLERYLRSGEVDEKAYERYLKSLPDLAEKAAQVETQMADADEASKEADDDSAERAATPP